MVKVCALAACSLPGSVCLEWIALLWVGQNGLPPTPNTLYLGCSYHLHSSHRFLSTWGVVMLERKEKKKWHFRYCIFLCSTVFCIAFRRTVWIFLIIEDLKEEGCVLKNAFSRSVMKFYCFCLIKSCVSAKTSCKHIVHGCPGCIQTDNCIRQCQLPSSSYNHNTLTTLRTPVKESLQIHFKVAVRNFHGPNASKWYPQRISEGWWYALCVRWTEQLPFKLPFRFQAYAISL